MIAALLTKYFDHHGPTIVARGRVDCLVVVPSSERPPPHPLHQILSEIGIQVPVLELLRRGVGPLDRVRAARDAFEVVDDLSSQHVLLVDDVYTTGSHINSAAATLRDAGHRISGALVIARRVNPGYLLEIEQFWQEQAAIPYDWQSSPTINRS